MHFTSLTQDDGLVLRRFSHDDVPGALWTPADGPHPRPHRRPLVLVGHGGGQSKTHPGVLARARRLASELGFAVAAIDAPGHGERPPTDELERLLAPIRAAAAAGEPIGPLFPALNLAMADWMVPEWSSVLSALLELDEIGGPAGYWGVSMGGAIGVALLAAEPRIEAGVLGLAGDYLAGHAARVRVPVRFLVQWDDEAVPRDAALGLFDAFGSADKSLHANPGGHGQVPEFEYDSAVRFLARHLTPAQAPPPETPQAPSPTPSPAPSPGPAN